MRIIAGRWRGRRLKAIRAKGVRPTTDRIREAWMAAMGVDLVDARLLDLFAGSGALGLEALSRGARSVVFVERSRPALKVLRANVALLGAEEDVRVVQDDALRFSDGLEPESFDVVLADPPYEQGLARDLLELFWEKGFASQLWVEHRSTDRVPDLPGLRKRRYGDTTISMLKRDA